MFGFTRAARPLAASFPFVVSSLAVGAAPFAQETEGGVSVAWDQRIGSDVSTSDFVSDSVADASTVYVSGLVSEAGSSRYSTQAYSIPDGGVLWETELEGGDFAPQVTLSPDGTQLYVAGSVDDSRSVVVAYDSTDGSELWSAEYDPGPGLGAALFDVRTSPDGSRVYMTGRVTAPSDFDLLAAAYDAATGAELWVVTEDSGDYDSGFRLVPDDSGDVVYVSGYIDEFATLALDADTGATLWSRIEPGLGASDCLDVAGGIVVSAGEIHNQNVDTFAYDAATGAPLWSLDLYTIATSEPEDLVLSADGSRVWITGNAENTATGDDYRTYCLDAATGALIWVTELEGDLSATMKTHDDPRELVLDATESRLVVAGTSTADKVQHWTVVAYEAQTGAEQWRDNGTPATRQARAVTLSDGGQQVIVSGSSDGIFSSLDFTTICYEANDGATDWIRTHNDFGAADDRFTDAVLSTGGDVLFAIGAAELNAVWTDTIAIDTSDGSTLWSSRVFAGDDDDHGPLSIVLSDDGQRAFVGIDSENGLRVVSFATPDGSLLWSTVLPGALKFPGGGGRLAVAPNGDVVAAWGSTDFRAAALSPIDGSLAWDTALPGAGQFALVTGLSVDSSGTVYFTGGSGTDAFEPFDIVTTALDGATGGELWTTSTGQPLRNEYGLDLGLSPDEGSLYVLAFGTTPSLQPAALYALDPADGSELWASDVPFHVGGFDVGPKGTRVYVAGGTQPGLDVAAFDAITGASLWTQEIDGPLQESAQGVTIDDEDLTLYVSGVVESFFDDSVAALFAFDPEDGAKLWSATIGGEGKHRGKLAVADTQASRVYLLGEAPSNGSVDGLALAADVPSLVTAAGELSLAAGGDTDFRLRGGPDRAFDIYWVFGSLSGTTPGIDLGTVTLPLNQDAWFDFTLGHPFAPALDGFFGQLDADGLGEATLKIPAGAAPALAGLTMHHAYLATPFASFPGADFASNAIALELQP